MIKYTITLKTDEKPVEFLAESIEIEEGFLCGKNDYYDIVFLMPTALVKYVSGSKESSEGQPVSGSVTTKLVVVGMLSVTLGIILGGYFHFSF